MNNNLHLLLINDDNIDFNIVGEIINELAQPLNIVHNRERRHVPKNENFFEVTIPQYVGDLFREHFRMSRAAFQELFQVIGNAIPQVRNKIPLDKKLLYTLWVISKPETFLASGDRFGMARSTAHNVFREIIDVLKNLIGTYIKWPEDYNAIQDAFHARWRIPGIVGAIDGCHIEIKQPTNNANDYYNRNNYHSIILQGICDHTMKFINVYIGVPGRVHDARVFRNSPIYANIHNMPRNLHILGDSAYPLSINVMTPFRDNGHLNEMETNYNINHSSARAVIERAFGRLKGKFRRLKYLDIFSPDFGCDIISAACILHNFIIIKDGIEDEEFEPDVGIINEAVDEPDQNRNLAAQKRIEIAELLM